jgi:hypothetical protein
LFKIEKKVFSHVCDAAQKEGEAVMQLKEICEK